METWGKQRMANMAVKTSTAVHCPSTAGINTRCLLLSARLGANASDLPGC